MRGSPDSPWEDSYTVPIAERLKNRFCLLVNILTATETKVNVPYLEARSIETRVRCGCYNDGESRYKTGDAVSTHRVVGSRLDSPSA